MSTKTDVDFDFKTEGIDRLLDLPQNTPFAKVGVLSSTNSRNPKKGETDVGTNVAIGMKHEFGSLTENIPQRSFLRMPLNKKRKKLLDSVKGKKTVDEIVSQLGLVGAVERLGVAAEGIVQDAFKTRGFGSWAPNAPSTVKSKGSNAPLIDTKQLSDSIVSQVVSKL